MTDLPELQTLLVGAAVRRRRRRRIRHALVAAVLLAMVPLLAREVAVPDSAEVPVAPPAPTAAPPRTVEEAFSVFRRPATDRDRPAGLRAGDDARFVGGPANQPVYLVRHGDNLCLALRTARRPMRCAMADAIVSGQSLLARFNGDPKGNRLSVILPDAVKAVRITSPGGRPFTLDAADALAVMVGGSVRLEWTAPDGTPRTEQHNGRGAETYWKRFWDVETPADRVDGLPGARRLVAEDDVTAHLVPRRNAICLVVRTDHDQRSACREPLGDTRFPIVIGVGGRPQNVVVAAFPDNLRPLAVEPYDVAHTLRADVLLLRDGDDAILFRYRDRASEREFRLPEQEIFAAHATWKDPGVLKPE